MKQTKQTSLDNEYEEINSENRLIWKPQIADVLTGTIMRRQKSNFGNSFIIETDNKESYILPNHQMLEDLLGKCMIGDKVRIVCGETIETSNGKNLQTYKVFLKKV
jgi:hypothetical protein